MPEQFLYQLLDGAAKMGFLKQEIPDSVAHNLNPQYELRPYQIDAFARFIHCYQNPFEGKARPLHLLFNMATGSGKTLIMAGLLLYLYEQGYRNFLFFVNSTNIIEKTRDNFLNPASIKYLFRAEMTMGNRRVRVTPVENFQAVNPNDINLCFTTIQKLHTDLNAQKENALTFDDFRRHRLVLIADEAHHMNVQTRAEAELSASWESTVQRIFAQNADNLLLEFTATHDYETPAMVEKYRHKVIVRYDLVQFRNDRFSKDVVIVQSDFEQDQRILQALILNQYKQAVAAKYRINLKPVILFKAQRTIAQSQENQANFHALIAGLTAHDIARIRSSNIPIVQSAFQFFDAHGITDAQVAERLKRDFQPDYCLSVNDENEKEAYQILVNTLEAPTNRIRAIFAVQKLNEGWDVLNLFDIVRCYETRDSRMDYVGKTTISEAQLIGRGARYFPFVLPAQPDRFRRKFDQNLDHELRVLEELHYHSVNDSRYISEITKALVAQGMLDERMVKRELKLKDSFKQTPFYKSGVVWLNERVKSDYHHVRSFADLGVKQKNYVHAIATGQGGANAVLANQTRTVVAEANRLEMRVSEFERNLIEAAIARNPFFTFASLQRYFPHLESMREFIASEKYLGGLAITFQGNVYGLADNKRAKLDALIGLLRQIELEMRQHITEYQGTREFRHQPVKQIFTDKTLKFSPDTERGKDDAEFEGFVSAQEWLAYNALYGTSEEKDLVRFLNAQMTQLQAKYAEIYLLRNEKHFALYNFANGQAFEPDFVLCLRASNGVTQTYQLFIEPKGKQLQDHDRWKAKFLEDITQTFKGKPLVFANTCYRLIGVPFYAKADENQFKAYLDDALS